jgi:hypothetical protein
MTWELVVPGLCYSSTTGCQTIPLPMHHRLLELRHLVVRVSRYPAATGPEKIFGRSRKLCLAVKNQKFFALTGHRPFFNLWRGWHTAELHIPAWNQHCPRQRQESHLDAMENGAGTVRQASSDRHECHAF